VSTHDKLHALRAYGLQCGTLTSVVQQVRALKRDGLTERQVTRAISNMHPRLMLNLRLRDETFEVIDKQLRWVRRHAWEAAAWQCTHCGHYTTELRPKGATSCSSCRRYKEQMRRWRREDKRRRRHA